MHKINKMIFVCSVLLLPFCSQATSATTSNIGVSVQVAQQLNSSATNLRVAMNNLWDDHVYLTREYILSALNNLPELNAVTTRLLQNQVDIGNAIKPYYGNAAGNQLTQLLHDHIIIATQVVAAAKNKDTVGFNTANANWVANADQIAHFLADANPNWNEKVLDDELHKHLQLTIAEVTDYMQGNWAAGMTDIDLGVQHMRNFANELANGIVQQFPQKFV